MTRETAQQIESAAAEWATQYALDSDNFDAAALAEWLAGDSRRRGAYLQAHAAAALLAEPALSHAPQRAKRWKMPRFFAGSNSHAKDQGQGGLLWGMRRSALIGILAVTLALGTGMARYFLPQGQEFATDIGEIRRLPLEDGSMAIINTQSQMQLSLSEKSRDVKLEKGEAWFKVAHDRARPFTVASGNIRVRALGTAFSVRKLKDGAQIIVNEGVVEVWAEGAAITRKRVAAGSSITIAEARPAVAEPVSANVALDLMWREGKVDLAGRSLSYAIGEFNRYNHRKLVLGDTALADERLHGIFSVSDPVQFALALRDGLDIPVDLAGNSDIILGHSEGKSVKD